MSITDNYLNITSSIAVRVQYSARHTSLAKMANYLKISWRMFLFVTFVNGSIFGSTQELTSGSGLELNSGELETQLLRKLLLYLSSHTSHTITCNKCIHLTLERVGHASRTVFLLSFYFIIRIIDKKYNEFCEPQ